jgi:uncharacterized protein (TIGR03437 family)
MADAQCVMFDVRPIFSWAPPADDPDLIQPDWSGAWALSFEGQAEVAVSSGGGSISGLTYDAASNRSSGTLNVGRGTGLMVLTFTQTKRQPSDAAGTGFRRLRLIRPGYAANSGQVFTNEYLQSLRPFSILRYMDFTSTNTNTTSANPGVRLEWANRVRISAATQSISAGGSWDYAILLANQTGTDMWINIPVSASDDYIRELALLIRAQLNPSRRIYIEHGNEVWNSLFANMYNFNRNAAAAEVNAGGSNLNSDGIGDTTTVATRRHLRRVIESVRIFGGVFGEQEINQRIRGVFAWWTIQPGQYRGALQWARTHYGDLNRVLYGVAQTHYYNVARASASATPEELLQVMRNDSSDGLRFDTAIRAAADEHGLRHLVYEGGPDVGGGSTVNVGNRIRANRLPAMRDLVRFDVKDNWFDRNGDVYMYFSHCGPCSRFGCWGATEDIMDLNTPKWQAVESLSGTPANPVSVSGIVNGASFSADAIAPGSFVSIFGSNLTNGTYTWGTSILDNRTLPSMLGGVRVQVAGQLAALNLASPTQLNVLLPPGLPAGSHPVEVWTMNGTWNGNVTLRAAAPGLFSFTVGGRTFASALVAGTSTYIAPSGLLSGVQSRPARAGDRLELYATGIGATQGTPPLNEALDRVYPVADLSRVRVSINGQPATVEFAGLTFAGVAQVNIVVPAGVPNGDQRLEIRVGDEPAHGALIAIQN